MTTQTLPAGTEGHPIDAALRLLVYEFSSAPLLNGKKMRDLVAADREGFRLAAASALQSASDPRGCRFLVTLLWEHNLLIPLLSEVSLSKELILTAAANAAKVDPLLHVRLARFLATRMSEGNELEEVASSRLLEVLSKVTDADVFRPFLRQMLLHPSARIRSKATLLVGRGESGFGALQRLAYDEDPRVRANAVEALWSSPHPQALAVFRESLNDSNNRVVGNAIFGLYQAGDLTSIAVLLATATHPDVLFRCTAVWVMGKTAHPRFLACLARMLAESTGQLRKTVFKAIESIKRSAQRRLESPPLRMFVIGRKRLSPERLQISLSISADSSTGAPQLKPTDIVVSCEHQPVESFTCVIETNGAMSIGILVPCRIPDGGGIDWDNALKGNLRARQRSEHWAVLRYRDGYASGAVIAAATNIFGKTLEGVPAAPAAAPVVPAYSANNSAIQAAIESSGARSDNTGLLCQAVAGLLGETAPTAGARHMILCSSGDPVTDDAEAEELVKAASGTGVVFHAVCATLDHRLEAICRDSGGLFRQFDASGPESELKQILAALRHHYILEFDHRGPEGSFPPISVQVHTPTASGALNDVTL